MFSWRKVRICILKATEKEFRLESSLRALKSV